MHFTLALGFLPLLASASPFRSDDNVLSPRAEPLPHIPWNITRLSTNSPSGRPGSTPWSYIRFTIEDTTRLDAGMSPYGHVFHTAGSANCSMKWDAYEPGGPWDRENKCGEEGSGHWTWWMRKPSGDWQSPTSSFDLEWRLQNKIRVLVESDNRLIDQEFVGRAHFQVGDNVSVLN